jgi:hypothetical protein
VKAAARHRHGCTLVAQPLVEHKALEGAVAPRGRDSPITTGQNATGVNAPLLPAIQTIRKSLPDDT